MSCLLTQGFTLDCLGDNAGGVKEIYITEFQNATAITTVSGAITAITMAAGKQFWAYELYSEQGEVSENAIKKPENGTIAHEQSVKIPLYKQETNKRNELYIVAKNRVLIIVKDSNDKYWLYGEGYGLNLVSRLATFGKLIDDRNGYELEFTGKEPLPSKEVASGIIAALLLPA